MSVLARIWVSNSNLIKIQRLEITKGVRINCTPLVHKCTSRTIPGNTNAVCKQMSAALRLSQIFPNLHHSRYKWTLRLVRKIRRRSSFGVQTHLWTLMIASIFLRFARTSRQMRLCAPILYIRIPQRWKTCSWDRCLRTQTQSEKNMKLHPPPLSFVVYSFRARKWPLLLPAQSIDFKCGFANGSGTSIWILVDVSSQSLE